ncbi:MAG: MgtC/SapB family protein [Steroidobacteraceae bacterium]
MESNLFGQLAISLLLGLLVGLQRERAESAIGGIRTFPLIAALGTLCGWLALEHGGWIVAAGLIALAALLVMSNFVLTRAGNHDAGQTSEVAALLLYSIGAYVVVGDLAVVVALGGVVAVLLHYKDPLHAFAAKIGERDVTAIMQFALISLVVLPVLPDRTYGPYEVLNPFQIWLMVVLIVGISLIGYVAYKLVGAKEGAVLGGVIGGLVSSTATTASFARLAAAAPKSAGLAALVIMIASAIVYARVITEVAVVAPGHVRQIIPPLAAMFVASAVIAAMLYLFSRDRHAAMAQHGNPADLRVALMFAGMYAVVSFAVAATKTEFGVQALYAVAVLSGLTDMDAITLSTSQLVNQGRLDTSTAWRVILVASLSNLVFKGIMVAVLGGRVLLRYVVMAFGAAMAVGGAVLWLWPA